jgi:hypothetical protein
MRQFLSSLMGRTFGSERRPSPARKTSRRARPELEALESRLTPVAIHNYENTYKVFPGPIQDFEIPKISPSPVSQIVRMGER